MSKFLRVFDRNHNILDELTGMDNLTYGWTLNDVDTLGCQLSLSDPKCIGSTVQFANHIEVTDDSTGAVVWGGQIAGQSFSDSRLKLNCLDYGSLMRWRRMRAKSYGAMDYGSLVSLMLADVNAVSQCGVTAGAIAAGALMTTRSVGNTDFLLDRIRAFCADANYDWQVDEYRHLNFFLRKGSDKPQYVLEYGGPADNIIQAPDMAVDMLNMANVVYSEIETPPLTSLAQDTAAQALYGLVEGVFSANAGVSVQSTLNNQVAGQLQRTAYPTRAVTLKARDSAMCPFDDLTVGDAVTVSLIPYFGYSQVMRIIRMVHDESAGVRDITFGEIIYRPQPPRKTLYRRM